MFKYTVSYNLRRIIVVVLVFIALLLVWYALTHGRLVAPSASQTTPVYFSKFSDKLRNTPTVSDNVSNIITSGTYSVSVSATDGNRIVTSANVGRVLSETRVDQKPQSNFITTLGRNSLSNIAMNKQGVVSYEDGTFRKIDASNITNENFNEFPAPSFPDFVDMQQLNSHTVVGFEYTGRGVQPVRYDTVTGQTTFYPLIPELRPEEAIVGDDTNTFVIFDKKHFTLHNHDVTSQNVTTISLTSIDDIAENDGRPVFSLANNSLAVVTGPDFVSSNDAAEELEGGDYTVRVFDVSSKKTTRELKFGDMPVLSTTLSPGGKSIAISTVMQTGIFNIETGDIQFIIPHAIEQFQWVDDNRYIFMSREEGIFSGSLTNEEAKTLFSYDDIRPTTIGFITEDELYFTGYSQAIPNAEYPDAYKVSLTKPATDATINGIRNFPHQGEGFYVDYLGGTVTVQLTRYISGGAPEVDETARKRAILYVRSALKNYPGEKIRYTYVDLVF